MLKLFHSLDLKLKSCLIALFGSAFLAFGLYHVHSFSGVTEGGVLGMTLLLDHWFHILPSVSGFIMNLACYASGIGNFWGGSSSPTPFFPAPASPCLTGSVSSFRPVAAACRYAACRIPARRGLRRRRCRALRADRRCPGGDDALAMSLSHVTHIKIQWIYLLSDFAVLVLSLSYIPLNRMVYSILTVLLSGQIIGFVQTAGTHPVENMET